MHYGAIPCVLCAATPFVDLSWIVRRALAPASASSSPSSLSPLHFPLEEKEASEGRMRLTTIAAFATLAAANDCHLAGMSKTTYATVS